jgi:multidrug resistance efflux pump
MIVFLTLLYCGLLALLVKLGIVRLNLFWKISPLMWMLFLFIILFIPMQWGAPSGSVNIYRNVVEIVPNVSGEVTEVPVNGLQLLKKGDVLFQIDPAPFQAEVNRLEAALAEAKQNVGQLKQTFQARSSALIKAEAERDLAQIAFDRAVAIQEKNLSAISEIDVDRARQTLAASAASVAMAENEKERARLAYESEIDGVNTTVAQLQAQLENARLNLGYTTVRAPSDGFVYGATLLPGQRVTSMPMRSWMAFINTSESSIVMSVRQYSVRHVKPGQPAEVTLAAFPGRTFKAEVEKIAYMTSEGQLKPTGDVTSLKQSRAQPLGVVLKLDEDTDLDLPMTPGGAVGTAAIYTSEAQAAHVIRRVMLRMQAWMNYVIPQ